MSGPRVYVLVLVALLGLTTLTIFVSYLDVGPFSAPVAFTIAATKAVLVMLFFMHLKDSHGVLWLAAIGGFFWLYFALTGVRALHLTIGIGVMTVIAALAWRGRFTPAYHNPVEIAGLYWHFVDVVWIFLLPLLYLVGRHAP